MGLQIKMILFIGLKKKLIFAEKTYCRNLKLLLIIGLSNKQTGFDYGFVKKTKKLMYYKFIRNLFIIGL